MCLHSERTLHGEVTPRQRPAGVPQAELGLQTQLRDSLVAGRRKAVQPVTQTQEVKHWGGIVPVHQRSPQSPWAGVSNRQSLALAAIPRGALSQRSFQSPESTAQQLRQVSQAAPAGSCWFWHGRCWKHQWMTGFGSKLWTPSWVQQAETALARVRAADVQRPGQPDLLCWGAGGRSETTATGPQGGRSSSRGRPLPHPHWVPARGGGNSHRALSSPAPGAPGLLRKAHSFQGTVYLPAPTLELGKWA